MTSFRQRDTRTMTAQRSDTAPPGTRIDFLKIRDMVAPGARVLDVGCGDGELLSLLAATRNVDGRGIEISQLGVNTAVSRGLAVIQGDADSDLSHYPDDSFDYVILSQTLQATRNPRHVVEDMLRIGRRAIVSFPNFGHWRVRWHLGAMGRMPVTPTLPSSWYDTPNIHLCTIRDFFGLCRSSDIAIERAIAIDAKGNARPIRSLQLANLLGEQGLFLLKGQS
ncbi:MAG: methionine biosynthesis protein MetW [Hypericibacter sp.]